MKIKKINIKETFDTHIDKIKQTMWLRINIEVERWKYYIPLDIYVSTKGRIKDKEGNLQTVCAQNNYLFYKGTPVHRIVIQTFKPIPNYATMTVDHLNHNTRDNSIENLEWVTREENLKREREDTADNSPVTHSATSEFVKLNGIKVDAKTAKALLKSLKGLDNKKIEDIFTKLSSTKFTSYGSYSIQYCEE